MHLGVWLLLFLPKGADANEIGVGRKALRRSEHRQGAWGNQA